MTRGAEADPSGDVRVVGRVVTSHGLRGELVVESRTDNAAARFRPDVVLGLAGPQAGGRAAVTVRAARPHGGRWLLTVDEVADREGAAALRGALLTAAALDDAPDDPDEFHDHQLEGLMVVCSDGTEVGTVRAITHGPGPDLLVITRAGAGGELLVPFVAAIVVEVDPAGGRLVLDPPEGLLDPT